jgi:hypothetical protein
MKLVMIFALAACGASPAPVAAPPAPPPATPAKPAVASEHAPLLFTVEQLRAGNPKGRVIELKIEIDGKPTTIQHMDFTAVDETSATIRLISRDEAGKVLLDETGTTKWAELHKHGQFPAAATTFEDNVSITVPAGTFKTRHYTVKADGATRQFWFATELPGPPVQFTTERDGKVVMRAQMLRAR